MAKLRSPNYPSLTLAESIEKVKSIYGVEHTHPAPKTVIAKDLGYGSLNGSSLTTIGALRRYGLLEDAGDGMRVSEGAVSIIELPAGDPARNAALRQAAFAPDLFEELRTQFGATLPGEGNLRHWLIKKDFLPKAADEVIRVYRENIELVGTADNGYTEAEIQMLSSEQTATLSPARKAPPADLTPQARSYAFDISIPRQVKGELRIVGQFGKEDLDRLKKALNGQLAMIEAALED